MIRRLKQRVFYGWWMVASGFGIQLLAAGLLGQSYGAYVVVLREEFGWSKTALSGAYSLQQVESGLLGPLQGWIIDRFGPRAVMRVGLVIFGAGFMLLSQVHSLPAFYAVILMMSVGNTLSGFFPLTVAIVNWFERQRARALSTMSLGLAVGGLVVPLVAYSLETLGWRETAFISGVLIIVLGLPLAQVIRRRPEEYGEVMDGLRAASSVNDHVRAVSSLSPPRDFTLREALRTPAFWFISLGHGSALLVVTAVNVHVVSHLAEGLGYSLAAAALVVTLMTGFQVVGMLIGGAIGDRFDKRLIAVACMAMHTAGLLLVAYAVNFAMVAAFAALHGIAWGLRGPLMQAIRADYFGRSSFGVIMGFSSMIVMLGTIAGPLVAGFLADRTGSYETGFTLLAVLTGLGSVFFFISHRPSLADEAPSSADPAATPSREV